MTRSVWLSSNLIFVADTPVVMRKPTSCKHFVTLSFKSYRWISRCIFGTPVVYGEAIIKLEISLQKLWTNSCCAVLSPSFFEIIATRCYGSHLNFFREAFLFEFPVPQFIYMLIIFSPKCLNYKSRTSQKIFGNFNCESESLDTNKSWNNWC